MASYCLNSNPTAKNGDYEVHRVSPETCPHLPKTTERVDLGDYPDCKTAIYVARRKFYKKAHLIDGCFYCANAAHTH